MYHETLQNDYLMFSEKLYSDKMIGTQMKELKMDTTLIYSMLTIHFSGFLPTIL